MKHSLQVLSTALVLLGLQGLVPACAAEVRQVPAPVEEIHLQVGQLPSVKLTADILYRILAAEIAAQHGDFIAASQTMLDLSKDTLDPRLAKRAFQMASAGRDMSEALDAAREWVLLAPD
ncbi:MAG TPA: hypothetical protein VFR20_04785, partial [Burkholderiaceae bacterium]|nr:hypothetical protein [Burkholderiaceae bacterium]